MLQDRPAGSTTYSGYLISVVLGMAFYFLVFGSDVLNPTHIAWLSQGDTAQAYLGWIFFRNSPWSFPVLGLTPHFGMEVSNAIVYSDSNPLLAVIFKLFNSYLPSDFQYFGMWLLLCCILQATFAWKIISNYSDSMILKVAGVLLLMFIPAWINRIYHINLMANFFILAAVFITISPRYRYNAISWGLLICSSILVHLYLSVMVCAFWGCVMLVNIINNRKLVLRVVLFQMLPIIVISAMLAYVFGYLSVSHGVAGQGFGAYRANLLSPFLANGWSLIINTHSYLPTEGEGFNFIGLGVIFLALINIINIYKSITISNFKKQLPILIAVICLFIYSLSNQIGIGPYTLHYPLPDFILRLCAMFRASGRFFWPVTYLFIVYLIVLTIKNNSREVSCYLLAFCAFVQIVDTSNGWSMIHKKYTTNEQSNWTPHLTSEFWANAANKYSNIRWVPFDNSSENYWKELSFYASKANKATNAVYMARFDTIKAGQMNKDVLESLLDGKYKKDTIYVMDKDWSSLITIQPYDLYAKIDGVYILAPGYGPCAQCQIIYQKRLIEKSFDFSQQGKNSLLLADGWSIPEVWGVWSSGKQATIMLPLNAGSHKITLKYNPFISSKSPVQHVVIKSQGITIANFKSSDGAGSSQEIALPDELTEGHKTISLHFEFQDAITPINAGLGPDTRMLAIGIKSISVE
ncbi:DUF6311 domain-containing protein [Rouxiella sp. T17]|uniref:DUF6311 domain-containing protein n=1 Tax=Rouxiella sp. T17 TaxID=3085684 RepID=UPI002FC60D68